MAHRGDGSKMCRAHQLWACLFQTVTTALPFKQELQYQVLVCLAEVMEQSQADRALPSGPAASELIKKERFCCGAAGTRIRSRSSVPLRARDLWSTCLTAALVGSSSTGTPRPGCTSSASRLCYPLSNARQHKPHS